MKVVYLSVLIVISFVLCCSIGHCNASLWDDIRQSMQKTLDQVSDTVSDTTCLLRSDVISDCKKDFDEIEKDVDNFDNSDEAKRKICCAISEMHHCIKKGVSKECGETAQKIADTAIDGIMKAKNVVETRDCSEYEHDSMQCILGAAQNMSGFTIIIICILITSTLLAFIFGTVYCLRTRRRRNRRY